MKSKFSLTWLSSTQPRKQRKYRFNAPMHKKGEFLNSRLTKELALKHGVRNIRVRSGDKVKILRGQFKNIEGEVTTVDVTRERVFIAGAENVKTDGNKVPYPIHPSNLLIQSVTEDKRRFKNVKVNK